MKSLASPKKTGGPLTKHIRLSPDGRLDSDGSACVMSSGAAHRLRLDDLQDFANRIHSLSANQAVALGALKPELPDIVEITTKQKLENLNGHARASDCADG